VLRKKGVEANAATAAAAALNVAGILADVEFVHSKEFSQICEIMDSGALHSTRLLWSWLAHDQSHYSRLSPPWYRRRCVGRTGRLGRNSKDRHRRIFQRVGMGDHFPRWRGPQCGSRTSIGQLRPALRLRNTTTPNLRSKSLDSPRHHRRAGACSMGLLLPRAGLGGYQGSRGIREANMTGDKKVIELSEIGAGLIGVSARTFLNDGG
jgi:hypothetical protein